MVIHDVKQGETISSIAEFYGKSADRLALENGISNSANLAIGETLVIVLPKIEYTVQDGDTLNSIAKGFNISIMELIRNNPFLSDRQYIFPGEVLVIKYDEEKIGTISTSGYVYPFININTLKKTLPFLTSLSIYSHYYTGEGEVLNIDDSEIIQTARDYGVAPVMILTGLSARPDEEIEVIHKILSSHELQENLLKNLITILQTKEYYGVNFTTPYISPEDRHLYTDFIRMFSTRLRAEGYRPFLTLTRSSFELMTNVDYGDLQFDILGELVDRVVLITYEWGFSYGLPPTIVAFDTIRNIVAYSIGLINPIKINFGYSTIGYVWRLPYIDGVTIAQSISYNSLINLAREHNAVIHFDEITKASYFQYFFDSEYIVRFRDVRGFNAILDMVPMYGVEGVAIWNVMYYFDQMWLLINSQYEIRKYLPVRMLEYNKEYNKLNLYGGCHDYSCC